MNKPGAVDTKVGVDALQELRELVAERRRLDASIAECVARCRRGEGHDERAARWDEIGSALGTSKQAAHKRYRDSAP